MGNRLAAYDNPHTCQIVNRWFKDVHGNEFRSHTGYVDLLDLYQSYHEYTTQKNHAYDRVDVHTFAKCLVACKIINMGGWWAYRPAYTPKRYEITRTTA